MPGPVGAAAGWLLFASLTVVTGVVASRWVLLSGEGDEHAALRLQAARLGTGGAAALVAALAGVFASQLLEFRDPFVPWREDAHLLLTGTAWGATWLTAAAASVLLVAAFGTAARGRRWGWWMGTVVGLGAGAFPAFTGHANAGDLRGLTLAADTLHVWGAGGWMGGLLVLMVLEGGRRRAGAGSILPLLVPAFSRLAMLCVGLLVSTGLFAAWVHLDGWGALVTTPYGRLLALKVVGVAGVLALGALNLRRWTPRLAYEEGQEGMRRTATWELALGGLVLLVTALLVRTSPM